MHADRPAPAELEQPLELSFPPDPDQLAWTRRALQEWLVDRVTDPAVVTDIVLAVSEACANAVEHGLRDNKDGTVRLRASRSDNQIHVVVADNGRWKNPSAQPDPYRGRGLALMRALMTEVEVRAEPDGTVVSLRARID
ncbi:ATP-binding protein [Nocardia takedensis]|uniref:ATP-binding protein n=1 Tax=Nocardia takedensis TaxID=259390 RepID=UPI000304032E|nr:ATP-binding protein [Nocardia takedensis]